MAKGKKQAEAKGRKITLKVARNSVRMTVDGKRRLDLSNMQIAAFPKCILKLSDVEELDLSRNMLRKIPDSIGQFPNLRWLDLHSNQLEQLPETIGQLQNLYYLNLANNRLGSAGLPAEIGLLRGLRSLNLGLNRLDTLPSSMAALRELRELGLFNNLLTRVPPCVRSLPKLGRLNIKCNPIPSPDRDRALDPIKRVRCLYLVTEDCLCEDCIKRCTDQRQWLQSRLSGGSPDRKPHFSGLITPNSVAQQDQALWR
ncbi:leucine-rich repeat-containing protein 18 [Megalops cyprinoides]|uniref:leucine-rich repeat-containing protein 18 n=1 Tax=Megalops cyprinoides TaxID=118141 RepID=UPI0018644A68|nr:leucine-rich repeat-containing protein 18 [Megalops cyprinoides]